MLTLNITAPTTGPACAAFTVPHGWGGIPSELPSLIMTSLGEIAYQPGTQYDATYLYLQASAPLLTAIAKVSGIVAGSIFPKIVYPSGGGTTLYFAKPPRNLKAYAAKPARFDARSNYGIHWAAVSRVDHYLVFDMPFIVAGADQAAWQAFLEWSHGGLNFDFYPSATSGAFSTYFIEDGDEKDLDYRSAGMYQLSSFKATQAIS